jgi:hypothetical protein
LVAENQVGSLSQNSRTHFLSSHSHWVVKYLVRIVSTEG